jgi:hypothetical protein
MVQSVLLVRFGPHYQQFPKDQLDPDRLERLKDQWVRWDRWCHWHQRYPELLKVRLVPSHLLALSVQWDQFDQWDRLALWVRQLLEGRWVRLGQRSQHRQRRLVLLDLGHLQYLMDPWVPLLLARQLVQLAP